MRRRPDVKAASLRAAAVLAAVGVVSFTAAPTAEAWPDAPGDLPLARKCVPQRALSPVLRAAQDALGVGCVRKLDYPITQPGQITVAATLSQLWCVVVNARPGAPIGALLSLGAAWRWCGHNHRHWLYVKYK